MAVTTNAQPVAQALNVSNAAIVNATGAAGTTAAPTSSGKAANTLTAFTAGANGSRVVSLIASSDDTTARVISVFRYDGTNSYFLFAVNVPITAGVATGVANVDLLASPIVGLPLDASGKPILVLKASDQILVGSQVAVTSAKTVSVNAFGEDF